VRDYLSLLLALLPRGDAWPREVGTFLHRLMDAVSAEFKRVDTAATDLMRELDPTTTSLFLPEFERELDLPGSCLELPPTDDLRRLAVTARETALGRQDAPYYIEVAAALGIEITITDERPFEMGLNGMGDGVGGNEYRHVFTVSVIGYVDAATSNILVCNINFLKPAHTVALFQYFGPLFLDGYDDGAVLLTEDNQRLSVRYL
jgi:uncharacterized protein YmfQ (DUF2313 family)